MFRSEFKSEWSRLTPRYRSADDGFWGVIKHSWLETWHGYFAPLWMLVWLARYPFKTGVQSND
jgi:hypothetical protein